MPLYILDVGHAEFSYIEFQVSRDELQYQMCIQSLAVILGYILYLQSHSTISSCILIYRHLSKKLPAYPLNTTNLVDSIFPVHYIW